MTITAAGRLNTGALFTSLFADWFPPVQHPAAPQVAARLARAMDRWSRLAEPYRSAAKVAIERVAAKTDLSNDVREVISRALSAA